MKKTFTLQEIDNIFSDRIRELDDIISECDGTMGDNQIRINCMNQKMELNIIKKRIFTPKD